MARRNSVSTTGRTRNILNTKPDGITWFGSIIPLATFNSGMVAVPVTTILGLRISDVPPFKLTV